MLNFYLLISSSNSERQTYEKEGIEILFLVALKFKFYIWKSEIVGYKEQPSSLKKIK